VKSHRMGSFCGGAVQPKVDGGARSENPPKWSMKYLVMRASSGRWQRTGSESKAVGRRRGGLTAKERTMPSCLWLFLSGGRQFGEEAQARAVLEEVALA
jgi:hypothetical protein